ncbi:MAG: hypothetical protein RL189_2627 [Pseudomonadota bacterium]|jgi:hypothetical protein
MPVTLPDVTCFPQNTSVARTPARIRGPAKIHFPVRRLFQWLSAAAHLQIRALGRVVCTSFFVAMARVCIGYFLCTTSEHSLVFFYNPDLHR